jgi:hypothetical protein
MAGITAQIALTDFTDIRAETTAEAYRQRTRSVWKLLAENTTRLLKWHSVKLGHSSKGHAAKIPRLSASKFSSHTQHHARFRRTAQKAQPAGDEIKISLSRDLMIIHSSSSLLHFFGRSISKSFELVSLCLFISLFTFAQIAALSESDKGKTTCTLQIEVTT